MIKGARQGSDNTEAQFFPECDGDVITGGDEVELHSIEIHRDSCILRVLAHLPSDTHAAGI